MVVTVESYGMTVATIVDINSITMLTLRVIVALLYVLLDRKTLK